MNRRTALATLAASPLVQSQEKSKRGKLPAKLDASISALSNLGYNPAQASAAVAAAVKELGMDADTAKLIRRGLKELAR